MSAPTRVTPAKIWELAYRCGVSDTGSPPRVVLSVAGNRVAVWSRKPIGVEMPFPETVSEAVEAFEFELAQQAEALPQRNHKARLDLHDGVSSAPRFAAISVQGQSLEPETNDRAALAMAEAVNELTLKATARVDVFYGALLDRANAMLDAAQQRQVEDHNTLISTMRTMADMLGRETKARYEAQAEMYRARAAAPAVDDSGEEAAPTGLLGLVQAWQSTVPENVQALVREHLPTVLEAVAELASETAKEKAATKAAARGALAVVPPSSVA